MTMTLLEICIEALEEVGVDPPSTITSGGDLGRQLFRIANTTGRDIAGRHKWQELQTEGSFTSVATEEQITIETEFPGLREILPNTMWNETQREPLIGPLTPAAWRKVQADDFTPSFPVFFIRGGKLYFPGEPTAGETIKFEYLDKRWVMSNDGMTYYERFQIDTDKPRIDDHAMVLGVRWRFLQAKGFEYGEHFRAYEDWISLRKGENKPFETLNMSPRATRWRGAAGEGDWLRGLTWDT